MCEVNYDNKLTCGYQTVQVDRTVQPEKVSSLRTKMELKAQIRATVSGKSQKERNNLKTKFGISTVENPLLRLPVDFCR